MVMLHSAKKVLVIALMVVHPLCVWGNDQASQKQVEEIRSAVERLFGSGYEVKSVKKTDLEYKTLTKSPAQSYHQLLRNNISALQVDTVRESVAYKIYIDSKEGLGLLAGYLKQENGLESLSIGNDETGYFINVNFSNRPPVIPELEAIYRKVGPISKSVQPKNSFYRSMR